MVTKIAKLSQQASDQASNVDPRNLMFVEDWFPQQSDKKEVTKIIMDPRNAWYTLISDHPLAIFKLNIREKRANIHRFCPAKDNAGSFQNTISALRDDLQKMGAAEIEIRVPKDIADQFVMNGFKKTGDLVRVSGPPIEMRMMPILRLTNPTQREIHDLSKLLYESTRALSQRGSPPLKWRNHHSERQYRDNTEHTSLTLPL